MKETPAPMTHEQERTLVRPAISESSDAKCSGAPAGVLRKPFDPRNRILRRLLLDTPGASLGPLISCSFDGLIFAPLWDSGNFLSCVQKCLAFPPRLLPKVTEIVDCVLNCVLILIKKKHVNLSIELKKDIENPCHFNAYPLNVIQVLPEVGQNVSLCFMSPRD
ncbi:hypothetical protein E2C01_100271 [Portunus trituberculatus]|uniref:Uncharacterized protein n=1 Tax=Portunus trituberculatus TaxID=210409 RepID=A0A5B7KD52_PORTR|nr:hypothetical protein [Portunus trituberculatus]